MSLSAKDADPRALPRAGHRRVHPVGLSFTVGFCLLLAVALAACSDGDDTNLSSRDTTTTSESDLDDQDAPTSTTPVAGGDIDDDGAAEVAAEAPTTVAPRTNSSTARTTGNRPATAGAVDLGTPEEVLVEVREMLDDSPADVEEVLDALETARRRTSR